MIENQISKCNKRVGGPAAGYGWRTLIGYRDDPRRSAEIMYELWMEADEYPARPSGCTALAFAASYAEVVTNVTITHDAMSGIGCRK